MYEVKGRPDLLNNPRIKVMIDMINKLDLRNRNILDIGCFDGTFLSLVKNRDNKFFGLDASNYAVKQSTKKGIKVKQFFFDNVTKMPYPSNSFDLIITGEIIEHIYDTDFFLEEIRRLLKKKGYLLLSTPNIASLGRRLMLLLGISPIIEVSPNEIDSPGHIRYFTFETLKGLLGKHGFKILVKRSDVLNLTSNGAVRSLIISKLFPTIGQSIIYLCQKVDQNHTRCVQQTLGVKDRSYAF